MRRNFKFVSLGLLVLAALVCSDCARRPRDTVFTHTASPREEERQQKILNLLRDQINLAYGFRSGVPRVNLGPCGQFAKAFHEQWNARFGEKARIAFVMSPDGNQCYHVAVRLPGGCYYDGGNGVMAGKALLKPWPKGARIDEMMEFDLRRLDKWSYGLERTDPRCPNYSGEKTTRLIEDHLAMLQKERNQAPETTRGK
jgi:hypothetical protein